MKKIQKIATSVGLGAATILMNTPLAFALDIDVENPDRGYATDIGTLIEAILSFVMILAALLVLGFLIMGGIEWITAGGDKGKTESARNKITGAIVGLIILAASFAILQLALNFLGFSNLQDALRGGKNIRGET